MPIESRPREVRLSSLLFLVTAVLALVMTLQSLLAWRHFEPAADTYVRMLSDGGFADAAAEPAGVRWDLAYTVAVTLGTALVCALLAVVIRQPLRWAQVAAWCTSFAVAVVLGCGLANGSATAGAKPEATSETLDRLDYDLLPQWYPIMNAVLGAALIVVVIAAGVLMLRSAVADFYRAGSRLPDDPRWASFLTQRLDDDPAVGQRATDERGTAD
ncbi:hypothetical protein [Actinoplanes sp. N902-109]|uniref:hypothetical protein n=1 Tax=Actinoplanes sp. (strain N902-109) TaxID=649831 RepID=UPI0003293651|nr:hypothetical protein [Actinoplanes sp. N902-109]AGL20497.1 hypothetical protein L083_6987 [Actinoplanes sp. N902-109]